MAYDRFPAVDENFDFPESVRTQLAKSPQLRNLIIPMTTLVRDALIGDQLWVGRTIFNTTTNTLESWTANDEWASYLDSTYEFPQPPPFWDENYDIPVEVREQLAVSAELKNMAIPMTEVERDALSGSNRWDGRLIFNTTSEKLEVWKASVSSWSEVLDSEYVEPAIEWQDYELELTYESSSIDLSSLFTAEARYRHDGYECVYAFKITLTDTLTQNNTFRRLMISMPVEIALNGTRAMSVGVLDTTALVDNTRYFLQLYTVYNGSKTLIALDYWNADGYLKNLKSNDPLVLTTDCIIEGQITYQTEEPGM